MTVRHRFELAIALAVTLSLASGIMYFVRWRVRRAVTLQGAVVVQDTDTRKELPISEVDVLATNGSGTEAVKSDASGRFAIKLKEGTRRGQPITLEFRHADYRPLVLHEFVGDKLYVVHMAPNAPASSNAGIQSITKIGNVRVRYSLKAMTEMNIGSAVKTFQIENEGNVPCKDRRPCSPDGKWKAGVGTASLDAGVGNEFRDARASCIAGPCPFTKIDADHFSRGGRVITVTARTWSDTVTFLLEAEVVHPMSSEIVHEFYPVIFGKGLSFSLPADAEGVSIEADIADQNVFFPLGPAFFLSWANCNASVNPDRTRVYRCEVKPGYQLQ